MMVDGRDIGSGLKIEQKLRYTETQDLIIHMGVACSYPAFFSWAPGIMQWISLNLTPGNVNT